VGVRFRVAIFWVGAPGNGRFNCRRLCRRSRYESLRREARERCIKSTRIVPSAAAGTGALERSKQNYELAITVNMRMRMTLWWLAGVGVNLIAKFHRHHHETAMTDTPLGDHVICHLLYLPCASFEHSDFHTGIVVEMDM
jgi:hypothetical protein